MITVAVATTMLAACSGRSLGPAGPAATQNRQQDRIQQGVKTGDLTPKEAQDLRAQQRDIANERQDARDGGVVTPQERRQIQQKQNEASKDIYEQKNDDDTR